MKTPSYCNLSMNTSSPSPKVRTVLLMVLYINMHTNQLCQKQFLLSYYGKSICYFSAGGMKSNHTIILTVSLHETATMAPKVHLTRWGSSWLDYGECFYHLEWSVMVFRPNFGGCCLNSWANLLLAIFISGLFPFMKQSPWPTRCT
jgi:hypothetical protein